MLLMLDNYDSFTYNLVQYLMAMDQEVKVVRNDDLAVAQVVALKPTCIVVSPGPKRPEDAGISVPLIRECSGRIPLLGVCLGHQSIGYAFGGTIVNAKRLMHGKVSEVEHNGEGLFAGIRSPLKATRYHSLVIERATLPGCLEVTATAEDGEIMGVRHREHLTVGVQFHPESILTPCGKRLLANFVKMATDAAGRG
ncbi:MAG: aminodeoxychorismate/anthranilate synthase component II [Lentisphaerae bacterium RIFOXYB12_FULL_65_16]|nr:MAG: aminodeoxychorismate/anthranilate synthase component II [Lentisphaerae bacterium RIFOXYA12_64_32]OGV87143.1 MAG: aminodeoxychorismate/anthranilate synthase component II [Lentisphaerae bacterium RIFOXYB12_FULL_65_16]